MYRRAVRLQLSDHNFIIAWRVRQLLHSYEYPVNFKAVQGRLCPCRKGANICLEKSVPGVIITIGTGKTRGAAPGRKGCTDADGKPAQGL